MPSALRRQNAIFVIVVTPFARSAPPLFSVVIGIAVGDSPSKAQNIKYF